MLSVPNNTLTYHPLDSTVYETDPSMHDPAVTPGKLIAPVKGLYMIEGFAMFAFGGTGMRTAWVETSTAGFAGMNQGRVDQISDGTRNHYFAPSAVQRMAAGDQALLVVYQDSGSARNVNIGSYLSLTFLSDY